MRSAFTPDLHRRAWPIEWEGELVIGTVAGGVPADPKVAESWVRAKMGETNERMIQEAIAEWLIANPGATADQAAAEIAKNRHLNGFRFVTTADDPDWKEHPSQLFLAGYQLKAALKEAISVTIASGKIAGKGWGETRKNLTSYAAEHVFVTDLDGDDRLWLWQGAEHDDDGNPTRVVPVTEPTGVQQRFVHTFRGSGITLEQHVDSAVVRFRVRTDHPFTLTQWAIIWLTGEWQGLGASRSQGYGRYTVTKWELVRDSRPAAQRKAKPILTDAAPDAEVEVEE